MQANAQRHRSSACCSKEAVWAFVDDPSSSTAAYMFSVFILLLIVLSTTTFVLETVDSIADGNRDVFFVMESSCMAIFTLEVLLRIFSTPSLCDFAGDLFNWIDIVAVLPYYLELALPGASGASSFGVVRVVRLVRVARVVKISRYSTSVRVFSQAMVSSLRPLSMLFFLVSIGTIMFSSAIYYAEFE